MQSLLDKNILLGVSGSIAAYKAAVLVRTLQQAGAHVRVMMSHAAAEFVTPLTFQALTGHTVYRDLLDEKAEAAMGHIELARWADTIVIAPASADVIARIVHGRADDLLTAVCLACPAPLAIVPAMNQHMWLNAATQDNIETLKSRRNVAVLGPAAGDQACGDVGPGRMLEPEQITAELVKVFSHESLLGKTVVITAGPTREAIDPVRFISNHSSGKMGFALAQAALEAGAKVVLITGPVSQSLTLSNKVERVDVTSAQQMHDVAMQQAQNADIFIGCAAVSDYRPAAAADHKIKKTGDTMSLELVRNPDIIADVAQRFPEVFTVGFAAETQAMEEHAQAKLATKKLNMIIANRVDDHSIGFNSDDNAVTVYWSGAEKQYQLSRKTQLAREIIGQISSLI